MVIQFLNLYKECYDHGIYNRGAGGDNPNVVASILRGIDPRETLDITPYATAISEFLLEQMFYIKIPRNLKWASIMALIARLMLHSRTLVSI